MLNLLVELFVSIVLCGAFVFFAFLNAPAEAGTSSEDETATAAADGLYASPLLPPHELPFYTVLSKCVSLGEDTPCGITYRWLLMNALHYSPREVYSEERLREWGGGVGDGAAVDDDDEAEEGAKKQVDEGEAGRAAAGVPSQHRCGATPLPPLNSSGGISSRTAASMPPRRSRRRHRRGGPPSAAVSPTPTRYESAHWVNVILRWAAFLCLGGGTVKPEVWTDHLVYYTEKVLSAVNAAYADKMRARAAEVRVVAAQLAGGLQQQQQQSSTGGSFAPSQIAALSQRQWPKQLLSSVPLSSPPLPFHAPAALVRVELLELGAGLLGGPTREVRRPQLSGAGEGAGVKRVDGAAAATTAGMGSGSSGANNATPLTSPTHSFPGGGGTPVPARAATTVVTPRGSASNSSPLQSSTYNNNSNSNSNPLQHSTIAAASVLLSSSMNGLNGALAGVASSVTAANLGNTNRNPAATAATAGGGVGSGSGMNDGGIAGVSGDYPGAVVMNVGVGVGAQLGVVLPRVEGDVISVEQPYNAADPSFLASATTTDGCPMPSTASGNPSPQPSPTPQPPALPLRCFAVPLLYEDQRFHLRLGCCIPLGALLPVSLCVPPDVLTLDCAVAVRRVIFNGHLYAAAYGARVELSFPVAPQFTAMVEVMPEHASGRVSSGVRGGFYGGAARVAGPHAFTAVNTTRNETTVGREASPSVRPPLPFAPRSNVNELSNVGGPRCGGTTASTTGASSINERNEKVQEVVLLAVQRLIQSLTYPNVLAGQLVCSPQPRSTDHGLAEAGSALSMRWQRTTASLPLRM
jgi:hypothetical protein